MPHFECGAFDHSATSPGAMTDESHVLWSGGVLGEDGGADKAREAKFAGISRRHADRLSLNKGGTAGRDKNPGGPVPLHENLAGKCGFAGH